MSFRSLFAALLLGSVAIPAAALAQPGTADVPLHAPRIMYWYGKVNQHVDTTTGAWMTDPDGASGADIDMLTYCRRWYPATVSTRAFGSETISTWRAAGNTGAYTATMPSYECVQPFVPRIMYWYGKVNQHVDMTSGAWMTDPDGSSGADLDMLTYCRRWYPSTRAVVPYARETISTWRAAGNTGAYTAEQISYWCMP